MLDKIIYYSYIAVFALVPFIWYPYNFELFEYNKMMVTYFLTIVIVGTWILKLINDKRLTVNRTPLDIPILLFLGANILSTIFSIDQHTSIWGYYSRSNGGLLSILSYTLLYFAFVSNITKEQIPKILRAAIVSGVLISLWAIMEHFGMSLSCLILRGELSANCWVQDVQARVFATLGQPNWLAAYLAMLIFPCLYFALSKPYRDPSASPQDDNLRLGILRKSSTILYTLYAIILYLAFTFTYSRGATLGFITGLVVFILFYFQILNLKFEVFNENLKLKIKNLLSIFLVFLIINILFGSALTDFKLLQKFAPPPRPSIAGQAQVGTQLETGGTESGQIRLIVWKGALDIFKAYPIFGSGVETFAYSYYKFRPAEHNLVSEWDFLYNKAHNEFLNYLANTGIVGFGTYFIMIITFIIVILKRSKPHFSLLTVALLASYISYLIQNIFGFSVVIIAIFFYLFPAIAFVATDSLKAFAFSKKLYPIPYTLYPIIYRRPIYTKATKLTLLFVICFLLFTLTRYWYADILYSRGEKQNEQGNVGAAFNDIYEASLINKGEPLYRSDLGYAAAASALSLKDVDATLSAELKDQAILETATALEKSPNNISFWRSAFRTYFQLSELDPEFEQLTVDAIDYTITLAPTDAKLFYHKGLILDDLERPQEAVEALKKATQLKPNYREAYISLAQIQFKLAKTTEEKKEAVATIKKVLEFIPGDPEVVEQLNTWGKEGVATESESIK